MEGTTQDQDLIMDRLDTSFAIASYHLQSPVFVAIIGQKYGLRPIYTLTYGDDASPLCGQELSEAVDTKLPKGRL